MVPGRVRRYPFSPGTGEAPAGGTGPWIGVLHIASIASGEVLHPAATARARWLITLDHQGSSFELIPGKSSLAIANRFRFGIREALHVERSQRGLVGFAVASRVVRVVRIEHPLVAARVVVAEAGRGDRRIGVRVDEVRARRMEPER